MPILKGRRAGGHPVSIVPVTGAAPSQIGSFVAGTPGTTTIPVTYTAASGTAPISYSGQTSLDNSTWTSNSGTFTGLSATFSGLTASTAYYLRIIATNTFGSSTTVYGSPSTVTTSSAAASAYTVAISPSSGLSGSTFSYTATPATGGWPSGEVITPTVTGGSASPTSATGSGTTPVVFTVTATGSGGTNCIVNSSAPGMANLTGSETYAINFAPSGTTTRFDAIPHTSSVVPSGSVGIDLVPFNGKWPNSGTITATPSAGTIAGGNTISVANGASTTATITLNAPSGSGPITVSLSNSMGINNPRVPMVVVFASNAGSAQTVTAGSTSIRDLRAWQTMVWSGNPTGCAAASGRTLGMGWGPVPLALNFGGASNAVYARVYDALSSGATSAAGTGSAVSNAFQIYGPVSSGAQTITAHLPTADEVCWVDIATNSAMSNALRYPLRYRVTDVLMACTRSQENGFINLYANPFLPGYKVFSPYINTTVIGGQNTSTSSDARGNSWLQVDGVQTDGTTTEYGSAGAQMAGQVSQAWKGHGLSITGLCCAGGNIDSFIHADRSDPNFGVPWGGFQAMIGEVDGNARYVHINWGGLSSPGTLADEVDPIRAFFAWVKANYPCVALISFNGANSGWFGADGSSIVDGSGKGATRLSDAFSADAAADPMIIMGGTSCDWGEFRTGHATYTSQTRYVAAHINDLMMADSPVAGGYGLGPSDRHVQFASTGQIVGDNIYLSYTLPAGATALVAQQFTTIQNATTPTPPNYVTPSAFDLSRAVVFYVGGPSGFGDYTKGIKLTGVTIDNANHRLVCAIDRSGGAGTVKMGDLSVISQPATLTAHVATDWSRMEPFDQSFCLGLFDNRTLPDGRAFGPHVQPQLDMVCS